MGDDPKDEKNGCCDPSAETPSCCSQPDSQAPQRTDAPCCCMSSPVRTLVFVLVIGAAVAVLGYGLAKKPTAGACGGRCAAAAPDQARPADDAVDWTSVPALAKAMEGQEAVLVLLQPSDPKASGDALANLNAAAESLRAKGKKVGVLALDWKSGGHASLTRRLNPAAFPCAVALGRDGGACKIPDKWTDEALMQAFVKATTPWTGCGPGDCGATPCCSQ